MIEEGNGTDRPRIIKKVIIFNGPPSSGKDTGALAVSAFVSQHARYMYPRHEKMATPLKKAVHALFNLHESVEFYDKPQNAHLKDEVHRDLFGMTPRQAYIWMSEEVLKPKIGADALGRLMEDWMRRSPNVQLHIFSDGGFVDEWLPVIDYVGAHNVLVIELIASGRSFDGDSRNYIGDALKELREDVTVRRIYNDIGDNLDRELFRTLCQGAAKKFLDIEVEE